jgi:lactoylglutathione lyase
MPPIDPVEMSLTSATVLFRLRSQRFRSKNILPSLCFSKKTLIRYLASSATMTDLSKYKFNHSMLRVKDPKKSVEFYEFLGMKLINKLPNPDAKFDLYFLAYDSPKAVSAGNHWTDREGIVELTHNYGTENDPEYQVNSGNKEPFRGFGHICISVDNLQAACQRVEDAGYKFQKKVISVD